MVHPADVPTKDKERRNRNDAVDARNDARKLARALRSGELTPLYVPGMCLNGRRWKPVHWFGRGELW